MDPVQYLTAARLVIVAGKGGVGKTTVSATLACAAARSGLDALVIDLEGSSGLPSKFGIADLAYDDCVLRARDDRAGHGEIRARRITPDDALVEYLNDHGLKRISKRLASTGALDVVATATPGIKDILVLGKVKQLERDAVVPDLGQELGHGGEDGSLSFPIAGAARWPRLLIRLRHDTYRINIDGAVAVAARGASDAGFARWFTPGRSWPCGVRSPVDS